MDLAVFLPQVWKFSLGSCTMSNFLVMTMLTRHSSATRIRPGTMVAVKQARTEVPLDQAYRTWAELGGISRPSGQAAASSAAV